MGIQLLDESEYSGRYDEITYSTLNWVESKSKKIWDLLITYSPILWIFLFLMLSVLVNLLGT